MQSWMYWKPDRSNRKIFLVFYPKNGRSESFESLALLEEHILVVSQKGMLRYLQWTESNRSLLIKWFAQHSCIIHMFQVLLRKIIKVFQRWSTVCYSFGLLLMKGEPYQYENFLNVLTNKKIFCLIVSCS